MHLGEDSVWEIKQLVFNGDRLKSSSRDDLADEMAAFANANGGFLLCGIADDGHIQGMTSKQMVAVSNLLVELSRDAIKPALTIEVHHRELDGKKFVLAKVPRGDTVHERDGRAFVRVGPTKRPLGDDERLRLAQKRGQNRYLWFDQQIVPNTGFNTLDERLWEPLLSVAGARNPRKGLLNLGILAEDEFEVERATVAGVLFCTKSPQEWLPQAEIIATYYRGENRASEQLDAQKIGGPLPLQIEEAVKFVIRNMRVAARKLPAREDMPQYSSKAIFEAVVNAVVHRDYSMSKRRIRLSMFKGRLEIDSPGDLPSGMTIEGMETSQVTRNEVIASIFGRMLVDDIPGASTRRYFMELRGDGVSVIKRETQKVVGGLPQYKVNDKSNLVLSIPAANLVLSPADSTVTIHSGGIPLSGVDVLALFPNSTWQRATTEEGGEATLNLYTTHLPMIVFAATPGYSGGVKHGWLPNQGGLLMELNSLSPGGAAIFPISDGHLPGLHGRLNPIRDTYDRTYMYADNIAIEEGRQQPVIFRLSKQLKLTDAYGYELYVTVIDIVGRSVLVEYRRDIDPDSSQ